MKQYRYMLYPLTLCQRVHFSMLTFTIIRPVHRLFHTAKTRRTSTSGPLIIGLESGVNGELASCLRTGLTVACAFPFQTTLCPPAEPDDPTISLRIIKNVVFLASYSPKMFSDSWVDTGVPVTQPSRASDLSYFKSPVPRFPILLSNPSLTQYMYMQVDVRPPVTDPILLLSQRFTTAFIVVTGSSRRSTLHRK